MNAAHASSVSVGRCEGCYYVSADHPAPERIRAQLDAAVQAALHGALAALGDAWFSDDDLSVWLIRRLEIEVDVNVAWDREVLARRWAMQIARRLADAMRDDGDGAVVIRFPSRAAYLAHFLVDLAAGRAWGRWYYQAFDGLRALPVSIATRTALADTPSTGLAALAALPPSSLAAVLREMTGADALRALERLSAGPYADAIRCLEVAWAAWASEALPPGLGEAHQALGLFVLASKQAEALAGPALKRAALALVCLGRLLKGVPATAHGLLAALERGDLAGLYSLAGPHDAEILSPLLRAPPVWVRMVVVALQARDRGCPAPEHVHEYTTRHTPFGGAFVLLPLLDRLPLGQLTAGWPATEDAEAPALLRYMLLVTCLGAERARQAFDDPALRDLLGINPALLPADLARLLAGVRSPQLGTLLDGLRAWWRAAGMVGDRTLYLAALRAPGQPIAVLLDAARGLWLAAAGYSPAEPAQLIDRLQAPLAELEPGAIVYADCAFLPSLQAAMPSLRAQPLPAPGTVEEDAAAVLARLDRLSDDLAYLYLPRVWAVPRTARLAIGLAAQGVLRDFAWRLPGFARSGLPYLYRNFLEFGAAVEEDTERLVVRLGRPPLNLVLNMTGMARGVVRLSWLDRPLALTQEQ